MAVSSSYLIPMGGPGELYYVYVHTGYSVPKSLFPWAERVETAMVSIGAILTSLPTEYDFIHEGRLGFDRHLKEAEAKGYSLEEIMCFVWYVLSEGEERGGV